ncbi:sensor domain-containing diguanylate cyclase [Sporomusa sp.]|uniref:sensor domain-containing diguanylate cyclase n=1 Tax=Sporomusa sp. TaxID=2078658 RepID=UPI002CB627AC|nr:sensor domain-containing diguanylate cyclase [Sporomusa sp.]HWR06994.1 sensor domain-containing diguanylate cyclase [Sporomusa sp.]
MNDHFRAFTSTVLDYLDEGVCFTDINKNIIYWNAGAKNIVGYQAEETTRKTCCQILAHSSVNGEKLCDTGCPLTKALQEGQPQEKDMFITHKEGHLIFATIRSFPVYNKDGELAGFIELFSDHSPKKLGHDKVKALTRVAYVDSLSELFSKQYIENKLQIMLKEIPEKRESFGIIYINITGFRAINELYGVSMADKILKAVASTLSAGISYPNLIGRWHGASFIAIIDTSKRSLLLMIADKLKLLVSDSAISLNGEKIRVTASVGCAISQSYDSLDYLIERATKASLEDKEPAAASISPTVNPAPAVEKQRNKSGFHSTRPRSD